MKKKFWRKILVFIASFALVFNSLVPAFPPSYIFAKELNEQVSPTPEISPTPTERPISTPTISLPPEDTITESASDSATVDINIDTQASEESATLAPPVWNTVDGVATTTGPVVLNQTYKAPQNDKVTVTFTKLPENPGTLTIKQIILSQEDKEDLGAFSDTAYEITSTMQDGTFEYTLTLPTPKTDGVEVKTSEDGEQFVEVDGESVSGDVVTIAGLNHFTVFVVVGTIASGQATTFNESNANVVINEFLFDPDDGNDWVELYNRSSAAVDLAGWKLDDTTSTMVTLSGMLPAGGFLVFEVSNRLNNPSSGDTINLKDSSGLLIDQVSYKDTTLVNGADNVGSVNEDESVGRTTDGIISGDIWTKYSEVTKGYNNSGNITFLNVGNIYPFASIADGLNQISTGGTINVRAGNYNESSMEIRNEGLRIIGPGIGEGIRRAVIEVDDCDDNFDFSDSFFHLHANNIVLQGLEIDAGGNCDHVVHVGDFSEIQVAGVQVTGNAIHGGRYGVTISWGSTNNSASPNIVSDNEIYDNSQVGVLLNSASNNKISSNRIHNNSDSGIKLIDCLENGVGNCGSSSPSGNSITGNTIKDNGADRTDRTGIHIFNGGNNNIASKNVISGNIEGVTNQDGGHIFDARENYWGDVSGPQHETTNPNGQGNSVSNNVLFKPFYVNSNLTILSVGKISGRKFNDLDADGRDNKGTDPGLSGWTIFLDTNNNGATDSGELTTTTDSSGEYSFTNLSAGEYRVKEVLQTNWQQTTATPSAITTSSGTNHPNINFGNVRFQPLQTAKFVAKSGNSGSTTEVLVLDKSTLSVTSGSGTSTISLPANTIITRTDGSTIDTSLLAVKEASIGSLSGLGSGVVADGALQWGIPSLGLTFSTPITLSIFVGTALNGTTLDVRRSTTGTDGWTQDGIEAPKTCLVAGGLCTFTATQASYYATTHTTTSASSSSSSSSGGGGGGGGDGRSDGLGKTSCNDAKPGGAPTLLSATPTINGVILTWSEASSPVTYYLVTYGSSSGAQTYGNPNVGGKGTTSFLVAGLSGGQTYYFKVRAGNGCTPGDYSNELSAAPAGITLTGPAVGFAPGVLGAKTEAEPSPTISSEPTSSSTQQPLGGLFVAIGSFLTAIASFFGRIFGR